jgi:diacylglycerol kinase (ATP)
VPRRALLLWNRNSRRGRELSLSEELRRVGIEAAEEPFSSPETISEAIRAHRNDVDLVIVGGGDGSLNAVAVGLIETGLPLGIVPLGTANDLARTLNLPLDVSEACAAIAAGKTRRIDVGQANDKYFFNVASMGLSVRITKALDKGTKRFWGSLAYAITAISVATAARSFRAEIVSASGAVEVHTLQIAVGNGHYYGGGMSVAPEAAIDDGRLDLFSLECSRWWRLVWLAPALWLGYHRLHPDVRTMSGEEFEIRTRHPLSVVADGEIVTRTPVKFRVIPAAITVFVP